METSDNDQYVTYSLTSVHDIQQSIVSHEEICEQAEILTSNDTQVVEIIGEKSSSDDENEVYPIYIKQEETPHYTSGDDESMAVEALRQLGGMYPTYTEKKLQNYDEPQKSSSNPENKEKNISYNENFISSSNDKTSHTEETSEFESGASERKNFRKFSCSTCGEKFERKLDLNNHLVCHQVDRPHACRTCGNLFRSKSSLQIHMSHFHNQEKSHKCTICGADFQRPSSLSNHMKIHTYVAGRALMTSTDTFTEQTSTAVQNLQNYEVTQVNWQGYTFQNEQNDLQEFAVLPNGEVAQFEYAGINQIGQTYNLNLNTFTSSDGLVKIETVPFEQRKNDFVTVEIDKNFNCNQCGAIFNKAGALAAHEKIHSAKNWSMPIECEYCDKQFQDANHLASHQTTCAKKLMLNNGDSGNGKWSKHACTECGKKFTTKQKMFRHQWIHRKKTHSCEVCGTQFEKQNQLDEHRLSAHPGDSPFTCTECGKSFVSRQGLWEHGRTHAGSPAHFHCDTCSKTFSSRQGYLIHHRTHTGERPYGCKFCWKAFRDGGTLRKHERIHTGERPHVCPLCSRAFNQKVVLREHVRWVHAAGKNETPIAGPPYPCPLCGALHQDRDELCAHIVKHSDQMIAEAKAKSNNNPAKAKAVKKKGKGKQPKKNEDKSNGKEADMILLVTSEKGHEKAEEEVAVDTINTLRVHFIDDKDTTLEIISKDNEELPVLAISNDNDEFAGEIERIEEGIYQDSDDEREMELICGICGDEFGDKNILMEHVKVHI